MKNPLTPAGIEPATFRFVAQHLKHCATAVPNDCTANWEKGSTRSHSVEYSLWKTLWASSKREYGWNDDYSMFCVASNAQNA